MTYLYEAVVFVERGWWVIEVPDIGARMRVGTLSEVDAAARTMIKRQLELPAERFALDIRVMRSSPDGVARVRWRSAVHSRSR